MAVTICRWFDAHRRGEASIGSCGPGNRAADDYLAKTFLPRELHGGIEAVRWRRSAGTMRPAHPLSRWRGAFSFGTNCL